MIYNKKLSNIELYYSPASLKDKNIIKIEGEELKHITKVMRHNPGDEIFVTNGQGIIYKTSIIKINSGYIELNISEIYNFENSKANLFFCIPRLKSTDRIEIALEKCTELGITNFIVFDSDRTIRKGNKPERWEKIITAAMKQSLRSYLPSLTMADSLAEIASKDGDMILFTQESERSFSYDAVNKRTNYYFIFGPEGDFTENEKQLFAMKDYYNLGNYRLRSETAIIKCASILSIA